MLKQINKETRTSRAVDNKVDALECHSLMQVLLGQLKKVNKTTLRGRKRKKIKKGSHTLFCWGASCCRGSLPHSNNNNNNVRLFSESCKINFYSNERA